MYLNTRYYDSLVKLLTVMRKVRRGHYILNKDKSSLSVIVDKYDLQMLTKPPYIELNLKRGEDLLNGESWMNPYLHIWSSIYDKKQNTWVVKHESRINNGNGNISMVYRTTTYVSFNSAGNAYLVIELENHIKDINTSDPEKTRYEITVLISNRLFNKFRYNTNRWIRTQLSRI